MTYGHGRAPRLARLLARLLLSRVDADRLVDALDEEFFESQLPAAGRLRAVAWYWKQVIASIGPLRSAARRRIVVSGGSDRRNGAGMLLEELLRDVRQGLRLLKRDPSFSAVAGVTMALGIGANAALFSVVRTVLLDPMPYDSPERIFRAWAQADDGSITDFSFRVTELKALESGGEFEAVGAEFPTDLTVLTADREPAHVPARMVSSGFFDVFGVRPARGRMFTASEIEGGQALLLVVSNGFAETRFGGAARAVGQRVDLDSGTYTVVGVLPSDYEHISGDRVALFVPYTIGTSSWTAHWLDLYVRAGPSDSALRVADEIDATMRSVAAMEGRTSGWHASVEPIREMVVGDVRLAVWAVFGTATLVLLAACVNVAILSLARSLGRRAELDLRRALGSGRARLVRQLVVENLVLALCGGMAGILLAGAGVAYLRRFAGLSVPRIGDVALDSTVVAFGFVVTVVTGLLFSLIPALGASRNGASGLSGGRTLIASRRDGRLFNGLVTAQVGLAVTLVVGSALLLQGFLLLRNDDMGFERGGTVAFRTVVPRARYPTGPSTYALYESLREALLSLPGVTAVGAGSDLPVSGEGAVASVTTQSRLQSGDQPAITVLQRRATEGFFEAMGTPILEGRGFDSRDRADVAQVTILSASLARTLFPGRSAVGERVGWGEDPSDDDWLTVIGVVEDVRYRSPDVAQYPQLYQAHGQSATREMAVILRTTSDPRGIIGSARGILKQLDPQLPMYSITTLRDLVDLAVAGRRFTTQLFGVFALLSLALTASGIFGVLTFRVRRMRREIGIRIALGARAGRVTGLVIGRALHLIAAGLVLGMCGAAVGYRMLDRILYRISPLDPVAYVAGVSVLGIVAVIAAYAPARTAASLEPMTVLKEQ